MSGERGNDEATESAIELVGRCAEKLGVGASDMFVCGFRQEVRCTCAMCLTIWGHIIAMPLHLRSSYLFVSFDKFVVADEAIDGYNESADKVKN